MKNRKKNVIGQLIEILVTFIILGGIMFIGAGRIDWIEGWAFIIIYLLISIIGSIWLLINDPQLLHERRQAILKSNVKAWDKVILFSNLILTLAFFFIIGIDSGKMQISNIPFIIRIFGGVIVLLSFGITLWASSVNTYMSALVRIQEERGHKTITNGPYHFIRHPMYAAMCLLYIGIPLLIRE